MRLTASATYRPRGDLGRYVQANVTPAVKSSVEASVKLVEAAAKAMCPRRTGALAESITSSVTETGKTVVGYVGSDLFYAPYVEFGTGIAGAGSAGAGQGPYNLNWHGMVAQPYLRTALDENRQPVMSVFRSNVQLGMK